MNQHSSKAYDKIYATSTEYRKHYTQSMYFQVWKTIMDKLYLDDDIVDLGCGPGHLAHMLHDNGFKNYTGIDFSEEAIAMARGKLLRGFVFFRWDITELYYNLNGKQKVYVSSECFEHLKDDRALLAKIPSGTRVVFSIPDFDYHNHYRKYPNETFIQEYYKDHLYISSIQKIPINNNHIFVVDAQIF